MKHNDLFKESCEWIKNNPDSSQFEIPQHFLSYWLVYDIESYLENPNLGEEKPF